MNILILAAGREVKSESQKEDYPSCLCELQGITVLQYLVESCLKLNSHNFIILFQKKDIEEYQLDRIVALLNPTITILAVENNTQGAACTALLAMEYINNKEELLIVNANEMIEADFLSIIIDFQKRQLDAGVITFPSMHPRYSYVSLGPDGSVVEVAEKKPISRHAIAGLYWFARGEDCVNSVQNMIRKNALVNGSFYISPSLNEMILQHFKIGVFAIQKNQYHPLKTKQQLLQFESMPRHGDKIA